MRELTDRLRAWRAAGTPFALATVVGVRGSAPRQPGAVMAVDAAGEAFGSVSGGCVEGAVYEVTTEVLATGTPVLETYGISDEDAFAVGLTCGGIIDVFVAPPDEAMFGALDAIIADEPVALATVLRGPASSPAGRRVAVFADRVVGALGAPGLDHAVLDDARGMLAAGQTGVRHYGPSGQRSPVDASSDVDAGGDGLPEDAVTVFVQAFAPPPRMYVFGAIDYASALVSMGRFLGYRVTVCDARPVFATPRRFPDAHEVVCEWPSRFLAKATVDERSVICVLTHDPKFDVPVLREALRSPAGYIGAMGSRRTHDDRLRRLREDGLTDTELARLRSPIGLDLGGRTPEETAVAVAAEIIQTVWGGSGAPLRRTDGRIHAAVGGLPE
jgi:xanthine dehydrogenase accessory factor